MTVTQLLKQVQALRPAERRQLVREILALEDAPPSRRSRGRRKAPVKWPDIEARAKQIVGDRVLPNLVLMERREQVHSTPEVLRDQKGRRPWPQEGYQPVAPPAPPQPPRGGTGVVDSPTAKPNQS